MVLVWAARGWFVVANGAGLAYIAYIIVLHGLFLTDTSLQIGLSQLGTDTPHFILAVIVASTTVLIIHAMFVTHCLASAVIMRIRRSRGPRVTLTAASVVPESHRNTSGKLVANKKAMVLDAWVRYSAEITRLSMLWEVALQSFQAYKTSYLVANASINRLMALVIVSNCWFSPLLHYAMGSRPKAHIRLGRLVIDSSLDVMYNVLIPLSIFYPYYRDYDGSASLFPLALYYDDTWYTNAVSELRQVLVTSWPDLISKTSGGLSLVHRFWRLNEAIDAVRDNLSRRRSGVLSLEQATSWYRSRCSRFLDLVLVLWGATVLGLHITTLVTSSHHHESSCLLEMRPWGSLSYSCASFEISCSKWQTTGDRDTMEQIVTTVDPTVLQSLILSNCEKLHVPHAIQNLVHLSMIKIYNSTIASWDTRAALRESLHPQLQVVYLVRVNMSEVPDGLLAPDFPPTVWDIEICVTNVSTIPSATTKAWANLGAITLEGNPNVTEFPEALASLPHLFVLNVGMSNIKTIRDGLLQSRQLVGIGMNGNPIDKLPLSITSIDRLKFLNFMETQIADIPSAWMDIRVPASMSSKTVSLFAAGSPLCRAIGAKQEVKKPTWLRIDCELLSSGLFSYAILEEDALRRANQ